MKLSHLHFYKRVLSRSVYDTLRIEQGREQSSRDKRTNRAARELSDKKERNSKMPNDDFFTKTCCDRCGGDLKSGRIMSMFNTDVLCMKCKDEESKRPDYRQAADEDCKAIQRGDYNFPGIGMEK